MATVLIHHGEMVGGASLQAKLYDLGRYLGAVLSRSPAARVTGELYRLLDAEKVFNTLDPYEDDEPKNNRGDIFRRRQVKVSLKTGKTAIAWAYIYSGSTVGRKTIPSGDYLIHLREKSRRTKW